MLIKSSSPCRISLLGGGSDVSPYCDLYSGMVLSMAINLRQEVELTIDDKDHYGELTFPLEGNRNFYKTIIEQLGFSQREVGLVARFDGEITGGIGSSAAATVALVGAIAKAKGIKYDKDEIARVAWNMEVNKLGLFGGKQDQWAAAHGGVNVFRFENGRVETISLSPSFIKPLLPMWPEVLLCFTSLLFGGIDILKSPPFFLLV